MKQQSITTLPRSPEDDRHSRMLKYSVMMAIRVVCIALCLFVQGWWLLVCAVGAIALPYVAVVVANSVRRPSTETVLRPGGIVPVNPRDQPPADDSRAE